MARIAGTDRYHTARRIAVRCGAADDGDVGGTSTRNALGNGRRLVLVGGSQSIGCGVAQRLDAASSG